MPRKKHYAKLLKAVAHIHADIAAYSGQAPTVELAVADAPTPPGTIRMTWRDYHG